MKIKSIKERYRACLCRFVQLWADLRRTEPCYFCGEPTRDQNIHGEFFHFECLKRRMAETESKRLRDEEDRRQIELYKKAILEIEAEKLNT
jgi:hypothetical protein